MDEFLKHVRAMMQSELGNQNKSLKTVWREVARQPVQPSPQQQWNEFMQATPDQRAQMVAQLGPQGYVDHARKMMETGSQFIGEAAFSLEPYFMQDVEGLDVALPTSPEQELNSLMDEAMKDMDLGG